MIRLSVVVPAFHDQESLDRTLLSLLENRPPACEIIVACTDQYVDPYGLDDEIRFVRTAARGDWPCLANQGLAASQGEVLHLLEPGIVVEEGWTEPALEVLTFERDVSAVSPLVYVDGAASASPLTGVRLGRGGRREEVAFNSRKSPIHSFQVLGPSRRAGFYRRSELVALGGWDSDIGALNADVDLGCALAIKGGRCKVVPSCQVKSWCTVDLPASGFVRGVNAVRLARRYADLFRHRPSLATRFRAAVGEAVRELPSPRAVGYLLGRIAGRFMTAKREVKVLAKDPASLAEQQTNKSQAA